LISAHIQNCQRHAIESRTVIKEKYKNLITSRTNKLRLKKKKNNNNNIIPSK